MSYQHGVQGLRLGAFPEFAVFHNCLRNVMAWQLWYVVARLLSVDVVLVRAKHGSLCKVKRLSGRLLDTVYAYYCRVQIYDTPLHAVLSSF